MKKALILYFGKKFYKNWLKKKRAEKSRRKNKLVNS